MPSNTLKNYAQSNKGYIIAPAGCGKTEFIVRALKLCEGKQLVLTHTNAGVRSLRERAIKRQLKSNKYTINTIAGFCLILCNSFPTISDITFDEYPSTNQDWNEVYRGAVKILSQPIGKKIIVNSYNGLFVDEYQDCLKVQHEIIQTIRKFIPVRIAGDPLQGIFDFGDNETIDWCTDVEENFTKISELTQPWRWLEKGTNQELGKWILDVRAKIIANEPIDLNDLPCEVKCIQPKSSGYYSEALANPGTEKTIFIVKWPYEAIQRAKSYGGLYNFMEEKELKDLKEMCSLLDSKQGFDLCSTIFGICSNCMSRISTDYKTIIDRIENRNKNLTYRLSKHREVASKLMNLISDKSYPLIKEIIEQIGSNDNCNIFRKELFQFLLKTLDEYNSGNYEELKGAIKEIRNRLRFYGRRIYNRSITRVLLIKGLEFDHALVDLAQEYTKHEFYVAISRPQKSLAIITNKKQISFD